MTTTKFIKRLNKHGLTTERRGKHLAIHCPNGNYVIAALTPSDHRSAKNTAAELRRNGAAIHWRHLT